MSQLLKSICEEHAECVFPTLNGKKLNIISDKLNEKSDNIESFVVAQNTSQKSLTEKIEELSSHIIPVANEHSGCSSFQIAQLFLNNLGTFSYRQLQNQNFVLLNKDQHLIRDINGLDKNYSREVIKVALIYVGKDQFDEASIFANSTGSEEYLEFVSCLGWEIDLETHPGYRGGLEVDSMLYGKATYYCSPTVELIFHDITKMINAPSDTKYLKKKRHIGNDHVHIIWNDSDHPYKWDTIGGDFGNAQIAITPLENKTFAIDIYRDTFVRPFGILQSKSVTTKAALADLVRFTAINAYRSAISGSNFPAHPFDIRKENINVIIERHAFPNPTYEKIMQSILTDATADNGREGQVS